MTRNNIIRFVKYNLYTHDKVTCSHSISPEDKGLNKQNKPSFSLKIPKVKTLCQGSQASATSYNALIRVHKIIFFSGRWLLGSAHRKGVSPLHS